MLRLVALCAAGLAFAPAPAGALTWNEIDQADPYSESWSLPETAVSDAGQYAAWIEDGELVVATAPRFEVRRLLPAGGQPALSAIYPSPDGRTLFVVRGKYTGCRGAAACREEAIAAAKGEPPKSDSRQLLTVDVVSGKIELIASSTAVPKPLPFEKSLAFAPDGRAFAYAEGKMLYEFRAGTDGKWQRRALLESDDARHEASVRLSDISYSPDGSRVAFVSHRRAKQSYIAIVELDSLRSRYLKPGIFADTSPTWSRDSKRLAFLREPGNWTMKYRFTPATNVVPWSIMMAELRDDADRVATLWTAQRGPGGALALDRFKGQPLLWTRDDRLIFPWERTGWRALYAVPSSGGPATLLSSDRGEVSAVALNADGTRLLYESNVDDLAGVQLWDLPLDGRKARRLTRNVGIEQIPQFLSSGYVSYLADTAGRRPIRRVVIDSTGREHVLTPTSATAAKYSGVWQQFVQGRSVELKADDGFVSHHIVYQPRTPAPAGGYPVLVTSHGGPRERVMAGQSDYANFAQYAVSRGYLVVDINYRGSVGFGYAFRLAAEAGATGGSEVKDIAAVVRYLHGRADVDSKRIGIVGHSYGGHIVGLALTRLAEEFAAGASLFGVADWIVEMQKDETDYSDGSAPPVFMPLSERTRVDDLAFASSPAANIDRWRAPVLFTMGELDYAGHMESMIDLGYRLLDRGVPVDFYVKPEGKHDVFAETVVLDFFDRTLRR
ncbi:S9 family peptidase [Steroidobacter sp.]|uniref:S9 family peptidase n=1 Tax=Steroidobacter sp. TaxID=1978227 RepID=UPI001A49DD2C|nr:prolyl oligopeptidase family serine peptidase [Steroidobacter sp.]MBL8270592.1 S9 family peptidase [Steroidobacter sp.]